MNEELVVLLDEAGTPVGSAPKATVHTATTPLHLAFSCHLIDDEGRILVTRRALTKRTWPGVWTNSFCGHPGPGEDLQDAARRRGRDELGVDLRELELVLPDFRYLATDASGIVENEICPVFVARLDGDPRPSAGEVMDWAWLPREDLARAVALAPFAFSPWLALQLEALAALDPAAIDG